MYPPQGQFPVPPVPAPHPGPHPGAHPGPHPQYGYLQPGYDAQPQPMYGAQPVSQEYSMMGVAPRQGGTPETVNFMPNISPMNIVAAGSLLTGGQRWGQQYYERVQQNMGWLSSAAVNALFNVSKAYVAEKLQFLLVPFLRKWTYTRQPEQIVGGQKYKPPRFDVNAPDMYIPLMAAWTYVMLAAVLRTLAHKFTPEIMYSTVSSTLFAWGAHMVLAKVVLLSIGVSSVAWVELAAYTGYPLVAVCVQTLAAALGGRWGFWLAWGYCSSAAAFFLVRTLTRVIFQEAKQYGQDMTRTNYILLVFGLAQYVFTFWLAVRV